MVLSVMSMLHLSLGIQYVSPVEEFPPEKWDKVIAVNLSASFHTSRLAVAGMKERGQILI